MIFLVFIKHGGDKKIQHKKLLECKVIRQEKKHGTRNSSVDSAELEDPIFAAEAIVKLGNRDYTCEVMRRRNLHQKKCD